MEKEGMLFINVKMPTVYDEQVGEPENGIDQGHYLRVTILYMLRLVAKDNFVSEKSDWL
jgi:hypothetical protein